MGAFASGVTVITGLDSTGPVGFTCQSFASVSLEPPLVLFCVRSESESWVRLRDTGWFTANVLGHRQEEMCRRFAAPTQYRLEGSGWQRSVIGTPSLPGVLARVHARIDRHVDAGDHVVVVGRVEALDGPYDGRPLLFYRGGFGLTDAVEPIDLRCGWE
ncbi:flavin reductase family protein [Nocardioides nitrophenolicus]|uniref:flavin reductase family protein n=1 Tax=Nocardioides nitrophenolicus TaxID=60489 RepID=UPI00195C2726|nr:flavin reductase family protein [Nocardioides nitrophenolicus]MBM7519332.1 flavin reductase (DIM6/NTAB) family NADH-FMN oxidoreductase RutF [Nocardioides nitrophenolicus]